MRNESRDAYVRDELSGAGPDGFAALLAGGDPRGLRNAVRARLVERLHHYQDSPYKSVSSRARKLLAEFGSEPLP
jgi:hypothetical protein